MGCFSYELKVCAIWIWVTFVFDWGVGIVDVCDLLRELLYGMVYICVGFAEGLQALS